MKAAPDGETQNTRRGPQLNPLAVQQWERATVELDPDCSEGETLIERVLRLQSEPFTVPDVEKALRCHWKTRAQWGGEMRDVCGCCSYGDGTPYLWPCPTRRYLTGEPAADPK